MIRHCPRCGSDRLERRTPERDDRERTCCAACGYIHYVGPVLAAGAILHDDGRFCLVRRALEPGRGLWTFPGGFVDLDEHPADAALRETAEETGHGAEIDGIVGAYRSTGPRGKQVVIVVYAARYTADVPKRAHVIEEVQEVRWFPADEIPWGDLAFESTKIALHDFLARD